MPNRSADPARVGEENTGLLRRRLIFADPERSVVRISPDGTQIAFRAPVDGVLSRSRVRARDQHCVARRLAIVQVALCLKTWRCGFNT